MSFVVDFVRQATYGWRDSSERTPRLIQGTSIAAPARFMMDLTESYHQWELNEIMKLSRRLPLFDSSELDEAQLADTRDFIRELRSIHRQLAAYDQSYYAAEFFSRRRKTWVLYNVHLSEVKRLGRSINKRLSRLHAQLQAQGPACVPQNAATVAKTELLLQNGLGLPLPVCWRILDMAEYWPQIKFTSTRKLRYSIHYHHTPPYDIELQVKVPRTPGFPAVRKVVLAIGGRSTWPYQDSHEKTWDSFEMETGGALPARRVTHDCSAAPCWKQYTPAVHLISWRYDDDEATREVFASLQPKAHLHITLTAPEHEPWRQHVELLRVELYFGRA